MPQDIIFTDIIIHMKLMSVIIMTDKVVLFKTVDQQFLSPENSNHRFPSPKNSSVLSVLFKTVDQLFSSPENSSAPVLFETVDQWFPSAENSNELVLFKTVDQRFYSPENSSAPVLFKTVDQWFPSAENSNELVLFKTVDQRFSSPENNTSLVPSKQYTTDFLLIKSKMPAPSREQCQYNLLWISTIHTVLQFHRYTNVNKPLKLTSKLTTSSIILEDVLECFLDYLGTERGKTTYISSKFHCIMAVIQIGLIS